ncbi:hypothetical protein G6675_09415, partial [Polynucleobacter paneuropaeus]|nr:hypothetical protein [Polynucleobacter paneuropaeus]MBT8601163.1 hypothetical protein [Polynucleobacter paneuropaeus]
GSVVLGSKTLTITSAADTFAGVISGTNGNLVISGGTQVLTNTNTYSGTTTINGTLSAASANALGTSAVSIGSAGTLDLSYNGTVTLGSSLSMTAGSAITNSTNNSALVVTGASSLSGNITTNGSQTYTGAVTLGANTAIATSNANVTFSSTLDSSATNYYGLAIINGTGNTTFTASVGSSSGTSALGYLCINASSCNASTVGTAQNTGTTTLGGNVITSGNQTYGGDLSIGSDLSLISTSNSGNGAITISGNVSGNASNLHLTMNSGNGAVSILGNITATALAYGSLSFNGSGQYVDISNTIFPTGSSSYTLSAWIDPVSLGTNGIIGWGPWGQGSKVNALRLCGACIVNYWWGNDLAASAPTLSSGLGQWHLVTVTYNQSTSLNQIYLDGALIGSRTGNMNVQPATNARIASTNGGEYFNGSISGVGVWNRALSSAEITSMLTAAPSMSSTGLVAYYNFSEGSGTTLTNVATGATSGNGTLVNNPTWSRSGPPVTGSSSSYGLASLSINSKSASSSITGTIGGSIAISYNSGAGYTGSNTGALTLTNTNTYTGTTTINGGTLALTGTGSIAASSSIIDNATLDISATTSGASIISLSGNSSGSVVLGSKTLTITNAADTFAGAISGTNGNLVLTTGTQVLTGTNTYTGTTTVNGGTLRLGTGGSLAAASALIMTGTSIFDLYGNSQSIASLTGATGNTVLNSKGSTASTLTVVGGTTTYAGVIADNAGTGGSVALALSGGSLTLSGANRYTGTTTINGGTLVLTGTGSIAASSSIIDNATFDISGTTSGASIISLSGNSAGSAALGSKTLTITNAADTFAGAISGTNGNLVLTTGTQVLTGTNTYTGTTTVNGGTLRLGTGGSLASASALIMTGTSIFDLYGNSQSIAS